MRVCSRMLTLTAPIPDPNAATEQLPDAQDEHDRPSITEVNGTVARFSMAYSAAATERDRVTFGAPLLTRAPSYVFGLFALGIATSVTLAYTVLPSHSKLYVWLVEGDKGRPVPAVVLAIVIACSGIATVVRAHMRGVIVTADGVEARSLLALGVPSVKRWNWAQIHRMIMDDQGILLELWDSTYERLPAVQDTQTLAGLLTEQAGKHGIVTTHLRD